MGENSSSNQSVCGLVSYSFLGGGIFFSMHTSSLPILILLQSFHRAFFTACLVHPMKSMKTPFDISSTTESQQAYSWPYCGSHPLHRFFFFLLLRTRKSHRVVALPPHCSSLLLGCLIACSVCCCRPLHILIWTAGKESVRMFIPPKYRVPPGHCISHFKSIFARTSKIYSCSLP